MSYNIVEERKEMYQLKAGRRKHIPRLTKKKNLVSLTFQVTEAERFAWRKYCDAVNMRYVDVFRLISWQAGIGLDIATNPVAGNADDDEGAATFRFNQSANHEMRDE